MRMTNLLACFWLALVILLVSGCDSAESKKGRFLLKGNAKLEDGDIQGAIKFYEEAIRVDNAYAEAYYNRGVAYQRLANLERAITDFSKALSINPAYGEALYQKAVAHLDYGENYKALEAARQLSQTEGFASKGFFILGLTYTELNDFDPALDAFEKAMALEPHNPDLWVNRATLRYYQGEHDRALVDLEKALTLNDKEPNAYNLEALVRFERKEYKEALEKVEKAIQLNPNQPYFYNNRGLFRLFNNQLEEGLSDINYSLNIDASNLYALRNKGIYYYLKGEQALAAQYLREVASKNNSLPMLAEYLEKVR